MPCARRNLEIISGGGGGALTWEEGGSEREQERQGKQRWAACPLELSKHFLGLGRPSPQIQMHAAPLTATTWRPENHSISAVGLGSASHHSLKPFKNQNPSELLGPWALAPPPVSPDRLGKWRGRAGERGEHSVAQRVVPLGLVVPLRLAVSPARAWVGGRGEGGGWGGGKLALTPGLPFRVTPGSLRCALHAGDIFKGPHASLAHCAVPSMCASQ